jgi:Neutral/alkaline non-lysosomal ceramidase, N-terminal
MRQGMLAIAAGLTALALWPAMAAGEIRAGAAVVDATWHVGASAGQYASDGTFAGDHGLDPNAHSTRRASSYGVQSRLSARAIVVESGGKRFALVKQDLYIPQDLLWRRTAQILEAGSSGIGKQNLVMAATHNHSSPYYSSISWGVWAFQDVFDLRFYTYYAQRMAEAVERAAARLRPARVGASVSYFDKTARHSFGPAVADDGTPAGYPNDDTDHDLTVVRFDDAATGEPIANLVNFSLHPEFLEGNDLISADYIGPLQRMVDRQTRAVTIWTQNAVGTAEPERSTYHSTHERLEFTHRDYAQAEYGARLMADTIVETWRDVERGTPEYPDRFVPFFSSGEVGFADRWFPGPNSHPYPGVSNCRTENPGVPVVGLPDCQRIGAPTPEQNPGVSIDTLQEAGIPVPENYSAPAYTGLEEDVSIHLQAFRIGDIAFTVCSCEQWADQSRNIKSRVLRSAGGEHLGYDWTKPHTRPDGSVVPGCTETGGGLWTCPNPGNPSQSLPPLPAAKVARMRAQVVNDASGWNDVSYLPWAESEPTDPAAIKGNYTHGGLPEAQRYGLVVPIGMGNDYNGYIATYREYQRGDHYRKALTGWGPHSSDYMASRLVGMAGQLRGGDGPPAEPLDAKQTVDLTHNDARAEALGRLGETALSAYEATLPDNGGEARVTKQPADVERFDAAFLQWNGGDNFTDNPVVRVQRRVEGEWVDYADQSGEVVVTVKYPAADGAPAYRTGDQEWIWTADFEAFVSRFDLGDRPRATPAGEYRFVVEGERRTGGARKPYRLESAVFRVKPWSGVTVNGLTIEGDGSVGFAVGPRRTLPLTSGGPAVSAEIGPIDYPDSYSEPEKPRFIRETRTAVRDPAAPGDPSRIEWYCFTCSFRPWADVGDAASATVTIVRRNGKADAVPATRQGGRWVTAERLKAGESAFVGAGCVRDEWGNHNGSPSSVVGPAVPAETVAAAACQPG